MTEHAKTSGVPDFQSVMLPLLRSLGDGETRSSVQLREVLAEHFGLTPQQREELLPSGKQPVFNNRVAWASVYLQRAGLLERPQRGHYRISAGGQHVLEDPPPRIDIGFLSQFPQFAEFRGGSSKSTADAPPVPLSDQTPEEMLELAYQRLHADLAAELLEQVRSCTPHFFEQLVVELLVKMGYGGSRHDAGQAIGRAGDEGIDGIIKEDRLGLDVIYVQAKKWEATVGRPEIQKFVGALHGKHARKGVFITAGAFSQEAQDYAATIDPKVVLIDGDLLAHLMIDYNLGVSAQQTYEVKRIDTDYFTE